MPEITIQLALIVFLVEFLCYFIKGIAAFGDPLISNPLLSMVMENKIISPMNLLMAAPVNAYIFWKNRKQFLVRKTIFMLISILCGIVPGTMLLKYASSWILKACLGILILGIGLEMITRNRSKPVNQNKIIMVIVSFFSGFSAGLYGINLFFVAYIERTTVDRASFRGNIGFIFFCGKCGKGHYLYLYGYFYQTYPVISFDFPPGYAPWFFSGIQGR
jgi:uncharacterized membrane protein YfcA